MYRVAGGRQCINGCERQRLHLYSELCPRAKFLIDFIEAIILIRQSLSFHLNITMQIIVGILPASWKNNLVEVFYRS